MNRAEPTMPAEAYKTYAIVAPKSTHWVDATCAEVECAHHLYGWQSVIDESTELGQRQAHYIRKQAGRRFTEERREGGLTAFVFEAGQVCFNAAKHQRRLDRPELYIVRDGDHRGNPRGTAPRQHVKAADWVDDFAEHQQALADEHQKG
ncbi:hypothetical protein AQI95_24610 [Streptomyces yokosukanensis]|uniref:Uncharacterized protein n=1 Tax=Streptomyces yokosukanensis TaxID=67386 RepID=A0A101P1G4_9ACTN|nr:hypothetical protein [Streptomyces yokosukanensis]KUN03143.1 hypothetical protein AQI95_24610 [Streptomyces yokosukanensis]